MPKVWQSREAGTGLISQNEKLLRLARSISIALPVAAAFFVASCTSTGSSLDVGAASIQPAATLALSQPNTAAAPAPDGAAQIPGSTEQQSAKLAASADAKTQTVALVPTTENPAETLKLASTAPGALPAPAVPETIGSPAPVIVMQPQTASVENVAGALAQPPVATAEVQAGKSVDPARFGGEAATQTATATEGAAGSGQVLTAAAPQATLTAAPPAKKKGLFGNLFGNQQSNAQKAATAPTTELALAAESDATPTKRATAVPLLEPAKASVQETPKLNLAKLEEPQITATDAPVANNGDLPGVRKGALFEIKRRDSLDSDADVDIGETDGGPVLLASAAGLARLAPNGLKVQRESVQVDCLKPQLVKMLKQIEAHYGRTVVVTSGYRSPTYNRRVRGAKNSLHMYCAAADIQVAGVGKWELAKYARSMSNRGGVGTYCHTDSVHVDVGPDRDWNWRCSRRK